MKSLKCNVWTESIPVYQRLLDALPCAAKNNLRNEKWVFRSHHEGDSDIIIDFQYIRLITEEFENWFQQVGIDVLYVSKMMFIDSVSLSSSGHYVNKINGIYLFWHFLASTNSVCLDKNNLRGMLEYFMFYSFYDGNLTRRYKPFSRALFTSRWSLSQWWPVLHDANESLISATVTDRLVKKIMKQIILSDNSEGGQSYRDWEEGGDFNYLTLDYGQYYIEHCLQFFQDNVALATAINHIYMAAPELAIEIGLPEEKVTNIISSVLEGERYNDILRSFRVRIQLVNPKKISALYYIVRNRLLLKTKEAGWLPYLTTANALTLAISTLGLPNDDNTRDRLRLIIWLWVAELDEPLATVLLEQSVPSVTVSEFRSCLSVLRAVHESRAFPLPTKKHYQSIGLNQLYRTGRGLKGPKVLARMTEQAGLTSIIALTGWRSSEYGFPVNHAEYYANDDVLDRYAAPCRFKVRWYVYKTSGKVLQDREISFSIYTAIGLMSRLTDARGDNPCLFRLSPVRRKTHDSRTQCTTAVQGLWENFVSNYPPFKTIDDQELYLHHPGRNLDVATLSDAETTTWNRLLRMRPASDWESMSFSAHLRECRRRCKSELPRVAFMFLDKTSARKGNWLLDYKHHKADPEVTSLLDSCLTQVIREMIAGLSDNDCSNPSLIRDISQGLIADCVYPTPHSFRHLWAEAVYRRFDGDIGWMIRSHFKHISQSMWLSYVKNKDRPSLDSRPKEVALNAVVHNYLLKQGEGYSGKFHTFLKRFIAKTSLYTTEQIKDAILDEIIGIKANPWGYCLLRQRAMHRAYCAVAGEPHRENAAPTLCLGCPHNLLTSENIDWILFFIQSHVALLMKPEIPYPFRRTSFELVSSAYRQVRLINPQHEALSELRDALNYWKKERLQ